jgi:hypothetical protein
MFCLAATGLNKIPISCNNRNLIFTAAIVQRLERLIVVQDVVGSNPTSRPTIFKNPLLVLSSKGFFICLSVFGGFAYT